MDDKILLFPDYKLFVRYDSSRNVWRIKSELYPFSVKHESLAKAFELVEREIELVSSAIDFSQRRIILNKILKSEFVIEFNERFYLCIYKDKKGNYKVVYQLGSINNRFELKEKKIDTEKIEILEDLISRIKINSKCKSGLDGHVYQLKIIYGNNEMKYKWWSGSLYDWIGLIDVIDEFNLIRRNIEE